MSKRELTPAERQQRRRARTTTGAAVVRRGIVPQCSEVCPWATGCKSRRCDRGLACKKIGPLRRKIESAYMALPGIRPEHEPLVRQVAQAQLLLTFLDFQIGRMGVTYERGDGRTGVCALLAERRRWAKLLLEYHDALGLSPKSAVTVKVQPMGLDEVRRRAEAIEAEVVE